VGVQLQVSVGEVEDWKDLDVEDDGTFLIVEPLDTQVTVRLRPPGYLGASRSNSEDRFYEFGLSYEGIPSDSLLSVNATGIAPQITFKIKEVTIIRFTAEEVVEVKAEVLGGSDELAFVTGQPVLASVSRCAWSRTAHTFEGVADFGDIPAVKGLELSLPPEGEDCKDVDVQLVKAGTLGCRVPMPAHVSTDKEPCADGKYDYLDEYFAEHPPTAKDLSLLGNGTFTLPFITPLCLASVGVSDAFETDGIGNRLRNILPKIGPREFDFALDPIEDLLLERPSAEGEICVSTDAVFRETDRVEFDFPLVEYYPVCTGDKIWPWDVCTCAAI
jgi:hypothetical protein